MASGKPVQQYSLATLLVPSFWQTHEVIGSPPNVSVPTHFAKVVLASKPSSPSTPDILELSTGAFVLPNAVIRDDTPFESFIVPGTCFFEGLEMQLKHCL
jgi:DNA/RNA endonuclease G (NUC1)